MIELKSSLKNKASLGHGAFSRVNEQYNAVNHLKNSLNLAAEIRVTGGVYEVDLDVLVVNCRILGENGDTSFFFKVTRVHNSGNGLLIFSVNSALLEHFVNESGFAVVNVCDYCDVSKICSYHGIISLSLFVICCFHSK